MTLSRRAFLRIASATAGALTLGPTRWGWATEASPFGELQDDPILRLPEGFSYVIVAETGTPLTAGPTPRPRPQFPDLNVAFPAADGKILLSTSHEIPSFFPLSPGGAGDDYDPLAGGSVTSLLLNPDLSIAEGTFNAGGMLTNCSGSGTPWGTVLTGEEETTTLAADHGYVWEVDPQKQTKLRLDDCGRFEHETAVVAPSTGYVMLTQDEGSALLYRMRPNVPGDLARGGVLEAYALGPGNGRGRWVPIDDPSADTAAQGKAAGALAFERLEGGRFSGRDFYFAETEDDASCGKIWRLDTRTDRLELWAEGEPGGAMCMPDNIAFDAAGNMFVTEDRNGATFDDPNRVVIVDRKTGEIATFAEVTMQPPVDGDDVTNEPTGVEFSPDGRILFLNLQRTPDFGMTLGITGPFAGSHTDRRWGRAAPPLAASPPEARAVRSEGLASLPVGVAAALVAVRRRAGVGELNDDLEGIARELGPPPKLAEPKRRRAKS